MDISKELNKHQACLKLALNQYDHQYYNKLIQRTCVDWQDEGQIIEHGTSKWKIESRVNAVDHNGMNLEILFKLIQGSLKNASLELCWVFNDWSPEHYVLMPGAAYNGNRFESRRIAYSPKLLDPKDIGPDKPMIISDVPRLNIHDGPSTIQERSGSMTTPSMGFHNPHKRTGMWLLTPQYNGQGDYGYTISEDRGRAQAVVRVISPVVRELHKYRITDNQWPSDDKPADFHEGDEVMMKCRIHFFDSNDVQSLFDELLPLRNAMVSNAPVTPVIPFSGTFGVQEKKFNEQNFVEKHGYYAVGMRQNFLQDWQIGWTGGMISTYPLLINGHAQTQENVIRNFQFLFPDGQAPSGFFWDCGESDDKQMHWYGGDIRKPHAKNWHLIRKSADALYYIIKQLEVMKNKSISIDSEWEKGTRKCADAFVRLWDKWGQFGNYVDSITGDVVVGGSTSAGLAPAALVLAYRYFDDNDYLRVAGQSAEYFFRDYVARGLTTGGVGDALQNPDSESAYAVLESFSVLYEETHEIRWLERTKDMARQFASWVMSYNYEFLNDCLLKRLGVGTKGTVFANTQNKHGAPGICTHSGVALLRLYRATNDPFFAELLQDITRHVTQIMSHPKRPVPDMPEGWITERISTTDWFEGLGEIMYGSTFAETSLMLTVAEIPAVYILPGQELIFSFDTLEANLLEITADKVHLQLTNPTVVDAEVKVMMEEEDHRTQKYNEYAMLNIPVFELPAGETKNIDLQRFNVDKSE